MEDRLTPGLYLELSQSTGEEYERDRVPALATLPGVARVWWWANAFPDRRDLPRRLHEFRVLGAAEVAADFVPPTGDGLHYRRTSRPGQGVLTGRPTTGLLLVLISPRRAEEAQALRDWADFVHIRHIAEAAVPGYGMITPYELPEGAGPRFLHWYEIDDGEPETVFQSMVPLVVQRLGPKGTPGFDAWADHPALRIEYVNTFRLLGSVAGTAIGRTAADRSAADRSAAASRTASDQSAAASRTAADRTAAADRAASADRTDPADRAASADRTDRAAGADRTDRVVPGTADEAS